MMTAIRSLMREITNESIRSLEGNDNLYCAFGDWMNNGGDTTLQQFSSLERWGQKDMLCYLEECSAYEIIEHNGNLYILTRAGLNNFFAGKELDEYTVGDFVWERTDYERQYFPDGKIFLVTGHTPVQYIRKNKQSIVCTENNHVAIDCGCIFGGRLAAYCIETGKTIYADSSNIER